MKSGDKKQQKKMRSHSGISRRGFLKSAALGAAAVTSADLLKEEVKATEAGY